MYEKYIKRIFDIIISLILIIILFPLIIIVGLITFVHLGRPIIDIRMKREGKDKEPFYMYKYRTRIYDNNELWGRKTKLSSFIDDCRLNELPQLFNVLIGNMSIVGPRPFICNEDLPDIEISPKRYKIRPGLTSLAQISGGFSLTHKEKLLYDIKYYDSLSFINDLKIIIKTPGSIIKQNIEMKKIKKN